MKKLFVFLIMIFALSALVTAHGGFYRGTNIVNDYDNFRAIVSVENTFDDNVDDVKFSVIDQINDLRVVRHVEEIGVDDVVTRQLASPLPYNIEPGCYDLRVVVSNDNLRHVRYVDYCVDKFGNVY